MPRTPANSSRKSAKRLLPALALLLALVTAWTAFAASTVPAPTITAAPAAQSNSAAASFSFADSQSGVTFECALDAAAFAACASPKSYSGLAAGSHTFNVRAVDKSKLSATTSYGWTVDLTPPPAPSITSQPANPTESRGAGFTFTDAESGATFECSLDGSAFAACTNPRSYTALALGAHTFRVRALDAAGNPSGATSYAWNINPAAPTFSQTPAAASQATSATFAFSSTTAGATYQCALDNAAFATCASPVNLSGLSEATHTFSVRAVASGRTSSTTSYGWVVDKTGPPQPLIIGKPASLSNTTSPTFSYTDTEAGVVFWCKLDTSLYGRCPSPYGFVNLAQGAHTFSVVARDAAGNVSAAATYSWTIDSIAPPAPVLTQKPSDPAPDNVATFSWTDSEGGVSFKCALENGAFTTCTSPFSGEVDTGSNGQHQFIVRAFDAAGNFSTTSYGWKVTDVGFNIAGNADGQLHPGTWHTLALRVTNPHNFTLLVTGISVAMPVMSPTGCDAATNLELQQSSISSAQPFSVPANSTASIPVAKRPQMRLRNLPVNQDACKNVTFNFTYSGTATK